MKEQQPTLAELHEAINEVDTGLSTADALVKSSAIQELPTPEIDDSIPPELILKKILQVGERRLAMIEEVQYVVIPELEAVKSRRKEAEAETLEEARENFQNARNLLETGIISRDEFKVIENALRRLPSNHTEYIMNSHQTADQSQKEAGGNAFTRFFRERRKNVSSPHDTPKSAEIKNYGGVDVPDGFESVLHHPIRTKTFDELKELADVEAVVKEPIDANPNLRSGEEFVENWVPEEYEIPVLEKSGGDIDLRLHTAKLEIEPTASEVELQTDQISISQTHGENGDKTYMDPDGAAIFIPEIETIFKRAPRLKKAFYATCHLPQFTVKDLIKQLFSEAIAKGEITQSLARHNIEANIIPRLISRDYSFGKYEKERDGQSIIYRFVHNDSEVSAAKTLDESPIETASESAQDVEDKQISAPNEAESKQNEGEIINLDEQKTTQQFPDEQSLELTSKRAKEVYRALAKLTLEGNIFIKRDDLVRDIFSADIASGKITLERARSRVKTGMIALRTALSSKKNPIVSIATEGKTAGMTYVLVINQNDGVIDGEPAISESNTNNENHVVQKPKLPEIQFEEGTKLKILGDILERKYYAGHSTHRDILIEAAYEAEISSGEITPAKAVRFFTMTLNYLKTHKYKKHGIDVKNTGSLRNPFYILEYKDGNEELEQMPPLTKEDPKTGIENDTVITNTKDADNLDLVANETAEVVLEQMAPESTEPEPKYTLPQKYEAVIMALSESSREHTQNIETIAQSRFPGKRIKNNQIITARMDIAEINRILSSQGINNFIILDGNNVYLNPFNGNSPLSEIGFSDKEKPAKPSPEVEEEPDNNDTIADIQLTESTEVQLAPVISTLSVTPKEDVRPLPTLKINTKLRTVILPNGKSLRFNYTSDWDLFLRLAKKPNQEITGTQLAGLDPAFKDKRATQKAIETFKNMRVRFGDNPQKPELLLDFGGNNYPKFKIAANIEFIEAETSQ